MSANKEEITNLLKEMKTEIRAMLEKYANAASQLAANETNPHLPVISVAQMALATASVEYLLVCGMPMPVAVHATTDTTEKSMQSWVTQLMKRFQPQQEDAKTPL